MSEKHFNAITFIKYFKKYAFDCAHSFLIRNFRFQPLMVNMHHAVPTFSTPWSPLSLKNNHTQK